MFYFDIFKKMTFQIPEQINFFGGGGLLGGE